MCSSGLSIGSSGVAGALICACCSFLAQIVARPVCCSLKPLRAVNDMLALKRKGV